MSVLVPSVENLYVGAGAGGKRAVWPLLLPNAERQRER